MPETTNIPLETRRRWPIRLVWTAFLFAVVAACIDYVVFQSREKQISAVVATFGGNHGSRGAWPIGVEHCITFSRPPTDDEVQQLAKVNAIHSSWRHYIGVSFKEGSLSEKQMWKIRSVLRDVHFGEWHSGPETSNR